MNDLLCGLSLFFILALMTVTYTTYKFISLPVITNLIYLHYGAKVAKEIIHEIKMPTNATTPVSLVENV